MREEMTKDRPPAETRLPNSYLLKHDFRDRISVFRQVVLLHHVEAKMVSDSAMSVRMDQGLLLVLAVPPRRLLRLIKPGNGMINKNIKISVWYGFRNLDFPRWIAQASLDCMMGKETKICGGLVEEQALHPLCNALTQGFSASPCTFISGSSCLADWI